jgi:hypothetical protein
MLKLDDLKHHGLREYLKAFGPSVKIIATGEITSRTAPTIWVIKTEVDNLPGSEFQYDNPFDCNIDINLLDFIGYDIDYNIE